MRIQPVLQQIQIMLRLQAFQLFNLPDILLPALEKINAFINQQHDHGNELACQNIPEDLSCSGFLVKDVNEEKTVNNQNRYKGENQDKAKLNQKPLQGLIIFRKPFPDLCDNEPVAIPEQKRKPERKEETEIKIRG